MVSDSPGWSRKKAMMFKTKLNKIQLLSRTMGVEKPISTLCHCWGVRPWHKAEVTEQWTKEEWQQRRQEGDALRLAQISEAELVAAAVSYPRGGHRRRGKRRGATKAGRCACVGKVDKQNAGDALSWKGWPQERLGEQLFKQCNYTFSILQRLLPCNYPFRVSEDMSLSLGCLAEA